MTSQTGFMGPRTLGGTSNDRAAPSRTRCLRLLAWGAIAGPLVFDLVAIIAGLMRPGYSLVSRPVSALAIGPDGVLMRACFILYGPVVSAAVVGSLRVFRREMDTARRLALTALLAIPPTGVTWAGIYTMEPDTLMLHTAGVQIAFALPIIFFPIAGRLLRGVPSLRSYGSWLMLGGPLTLVAIIGFMQSVPFDQMAVGGGHFGLWQRAMTVEVQGWYAALGWLAMGRLALAKGQQGPPMEGMIATWYAKITKGDLREYSDLAKTIASRLPPGANVLEIAPGPGYLAIELAKLGRQRVSGLDISHSFVRIATGNAKAAGVPIEFRRGNASQLPYADESFDFVWTRAAFKNFSDPVGAINEIHRVLKPGGSASIFDLRKESSPDDVKRHIVTMRLAPLNAWMTALTFRFFLLKNAYSKQAMERMAAGSRFGTCEFLASGIEFDARFVKAETVVRESSTDWTTGALTSKDGTAIGYRRIGQGPGIVVLHGAFESAASHAELAGALADSFTVYLPDRRGRGMSGQHGQGYRVGKEIEDLDALLNHADAHFVFGVSAGAIICLQAALELPAIQKAAIFEPPWCIDMADASAFLHRMDREIADGKVASALVTAMKGAQMGPPIFKFVPRWALEGLTTLMLWMDERSAKPGDVTVRQLAPTLRYDFQIVLESDGAVGRFKATQAEVLLLGGSNSPAFLKDSMEALAKVFPESRRAEFPGVGHGASGNANRGGAPQVVADELRRFFGKGA